MPTKIEWTDEVWNPVTGCTRVSRGCDHCYAERMAKRLHGRFGYPERHPFRVTVHEDRLKQPLHWRKPRRIFVCSMGDLFHGDVPQSFLERVFAVMAISPSHTFLVLTKRPARMREYLSNRSARMIAWGHQACAVLDRFEGFHRPVEELKAHCASREPEWPLPNVWLGVSIEDQATAERRIADLFETAASLRFVSCEPLLGPVWLGRWLYGKRLSCHKPSKGLYDIDRRRLDWVIVGSESGPRRRETDVAWIRSIRDQCSRARVPFFLKQLHIDGKRVGTPELDGFSHQEFPR